MSTRSALYTGLVIHRRFGAKSHALRYRMMMALVDLGEIERVARGLRLLSLGRFNLFSFYESDHLPATPGASLAARVETLLREAGLELPGGSTEVLALPRILGFAFNPLSVFFCRGADGVIAALIYEVRNTFGERHSYLIPVVDAGAPGERIEQSCDKVFYVSPFMDMDMTYAFEIVPPGETVSIAVHVSKAGVSEAGVSEAGVSEAGERVLAASFAARRVPLSDRALAWCFLGHPLLALAIVAGIHWEALKIWLKGIRLRTRSAPPARPVSIVPSSIVPFEES